VTSLAGATVSAIDGQPISGVTVMIGGQSAVSDGTGEFHVPYVGDGSETAILSGPSVVERRTRLSGPFTGPLRESLIPATFDLAAFDQMFRGNNNQLQRWITPPGLVVLTTVMNFETGFGAQQETFHASSEQLTEAETALLIDQLTEALGMLTGNTFTAFSSVERESASSGASVNTLRAGKIVVGRYKGIQGLLNTIGFGRWANGASGEVDGGAVYLDRDFDKSSDQRRLLRTHELGHALGYLHVTTRTSIMNPAIGPEPTLFDRQGAMVAFQRAPGNRSPDLDPETASPSPSGGIFGVIPPSPRILNWSAPTSCTLR
jgi:hypothetical protein